MKNALCLAAVLIAGTAYARQASDPWAEMAQYRFPPSLCDELVRSRIG